MSEPLLEVGDCFRIYFKPQQYKQLKELVKGVGIPHLKRLERAVSGAQIRKRPTNRMTRKQRAEWVAEELQELLCEVQTLQEEMEGWVDGQAGTPFENTAQYQEVLKCSMFMAAIANKLEGSVVSLEKCEFPGWEDAGAARGRANAVVKKRRLAKKRR